MSKQRHKNKIIISHVITLILLGSCLAVIISVSINIVKDGIPRIFNYSIHVVLTDSMEPAINVKDVVIAKKVDKDEIIIGDDIVFRSQEPSLAGILIVHRVVGIDQNGDFITQGIKHGASVDKLPTQTPIGKVVSVSPLFGQILSVVIDYKPLIFAVFIASIGVYMIFIIKNITKKQQPNGEEINDIRQKVMDDLKKEISEELQKERLDTNVQNLSNTSTEQPVQKNYSLENKKQKSETNKKT